MIFIGLACITRMWVNAQRDGRRAEYRSRALCSTPQSLADAPTTVPCSNAAKTRNPLTLGGVPPNNRTDLSRYWAEVYHVVRTCGEDVAA